MSIKNTAYVVFGPKACGKTRNKAAIAKHLTGDVNAVIDDYGWDPRHRLTPGMVHLTFETPQRGVARWSPSFDSMVVRFISFAEIMADIKAAAR